SATKLGKTEGKRETQTGLTDESSVQSPEDSSGETMLGNTEIHEAVDSQNDNEVHPLEALFKRKKPTEKNKLALEVNTSFSFFGKTEDDEMEVDEDVDAETNSRQLAPLTPYTKR